MASDGEIDCSLGMTGSPSDNGKIGFFHQSVGKLLGECGVRLVVFCHDDAATGLLVETVNDTGAMLFRAAGEDAAMVQECIDESSLLMTGSDVDDHAGWFVDDDEVFILVQDFQRDIFRARSERRLGRFFLDDKDIPRLHFVIIAHGIAPQRDAARFDECLELGAGKLWQIADKDHIDALAAILFGGGDFVNGGMGHS